ncbi:MAG TPA: hypothetical protein VLK56_02755, partial [Solirubrobacterales bacterium]|nr:hypothetical protein [Solirubrobacterales bacterium]
RRAAAGQPSLATPPPPAPAPAPSFAPPTSLLPPPPPPPVPASPPPPSPPAHHPLPVPLPAASYVAPAINPTPLVPIVPPPPAPAFEPTPPSGTSPVTAPQPDREEEAAFDLVHHMAAHGPRALAGNGLTAAALGERGGGLPPALLPALALLAAMGTATGLRAMRPRRDRRSQPAFETTIPSRRYR